MSFLSRSRLLRLTSALLLSACLSPFLPAHAQQVLRVTAIPDESPTELARKAAPLMRYLESRLGMKVEFTPVTDYAAAVETLINRKVDLAWLGGFTLYRAYTRTITGWVWRASDNRIVEGHHPNGGVSAIASF